MGQLPLPGCATMRKDAAADAAPSRRTSEKEKAPLLQIFISAACVYAPRDGSPATTTLLLPTAHYFCRVITLWTADCSIYRTRYAAPRRFRRFYCLHLLAIITTWHHLLSTDAGFSFLHGQCSHVVSRPPHDQYTVRLTF